MLQVINYLQRTEGREEERGEVRGVAPTCKTTAFNSLAECGPLTLFIFTVYDLCDPLLRIQFTLAIRVVSTLLTRVVHPLKNRAVKKTRYFRVN